MQVFTANALLLPSRRLTATTTRSQADTQIADLGQDGWLVGTDGLWAMTSAGIVTVGNETYVLAVAAAHQPSLGEAQTIMRQVGVQVAGHLTKEE
jgi:hypothetical protein